MEGKYCIPLVDSAIHGWEEIPWMDGTSTNPSIYLIAKFYHRWRLMCGWVLFKFLPSMGITAHSWEFLPSMDGRSPWLECNIRTIIKALNGFEGAVAIT